MTQLIILFGAMTVLAGVVILINPEIIFGLLRENLNKPLLHVLAVVIRLIVGLLLIFQSGVSRFPLVILILGWLSIVAALTLAVIRRKNFKRLMSCVLSTMEPFHRAGGLFAAAFGAFLIYAFVY